MVAEEALAKGISVKAGIESPNSPAVGQIIPGTTSKIFSSAEWETALAGVDAVVSFSSPDAEAFLAPKIAGKSLPLAIGTTGLSEEQKQSIAKAVAAGGGSCIIAPNYSPLVNAQFALTRKAVQILCPLGYDVGVLEEHHSAKADSPSGTAKRLILEIREGGGPQKERFWGAENARKREGELDIAVLRLGGTPGEHEVRIVGKHGRLTIGSLVYSRQEFALGALSAVEWLAIHPDEKGMIELKRILGV